jgi:hypothetical protein
LVKGIDLVGEDGKTTMSQMNQVSYMVPKYWKVLSHPGLAPFLLLVQKADARLKKQTFTCGPDGSGSVAKTKPRCGSRSVRSAKHS